MSRPIRERERDKFWLPTPPKSMPRNCKREVPDNYFLGCWVQDTNLNEKRSADSVLVALKFQEFLDKTAASEFFNSRAWPTEFVSEKPKGASNPGQQHESDPLQKINSLLM